MILTEHINRHYLTLVILLISIQTLLAEHGNGQKNSKQPRNPKNKLLLMMYDGMRWDTVNMPGLPGMQMLKKEGVQAQHLIPCFPTSSLTNHLCTITGLYSESHTLIENDVYDETTKQTLTLKDMIHGHLFDQPKWWTQVEPIWMTAIRQKKRVKGYHWFECPVISGGINLTGDQCVRCGNFTKDTLTWAVNDALEKLANDELDFAAIFHDEPDYTQHVHGFNSLKALKAIRDLDDIVLQLQTNSSALKMPDGIRLSDRLNFMLVSDHGQMNLTQDGAVNVTGVFVKYDVMKVLTSGPQLQVWPKDNADQIVTELRKLSHVQVYHRDEIPDRWHYKRSPYTAPILALVDPGHYFISPDVTQLGYRAETHAYTKSHHGYDNNVAEMQAIFLARGPNFKHGLITEALENVHLYQIMCAILGIQPSPNNGTFSVVMNFTFGLFPSAPSKQGVSLNSGVYTLLIAQSAVLLIIGVGCLVHYAKEKKRTKQCRKLLPLLGQCL